MKYIFVLLLAILLFGCNSDENPVNSGTTGYPNINGWDLVYSKTEMDSSRVYIQGKIITIGYIDFREYRNAKMHFEYKSDSTFNLKLISKSGYHFLIENLNKTVNWTYVADSVSGFGTGNLIDSLHFKISVQNPMNIAFKNLNVYFK